ncbi:MAG: GWxTD domain-containing protein [Bacteroidota bacterium]
MRPRSALLLLAAVAAACSAPPAGPRLDEGAVAYRSGEPAFVLDAVASVRGDSLGIDVYLGLPPQSLVFSQRGDQRIGIAQWTLTVEREGGAPLMRSPVDTLVGPLALDAPPTWRTERIDVPPGTYRVRAVLEDRASDRTAERTAEVDVRRPRGTPSLGRIRLDRGSGVSSRPVDSGAVPASSDSIRAIVQALALPPDAATQLTVLRLRADSSAALPLVGFTPGPATLAARGVDLGSVDTVQTVRQPILNPDVTLDVEAPLPPLRPGVYRVQIVLEGEGGERLDVSDRLLVVRRRDYPYVTRVGDLVGPLQYLVSERELRDLREAPTPAGQQRAFDRFWGDQIDDRRLATATVRAFYERVEEANRLFATYKEGWKTDAGMAYIVFGPPAFVERTIEGERWTYGRGAGSPSVLEFVRTAGRPGTRDRFQVLTLIRDRAYTGVWRRAQRQWRSGAVPGS